MNFGKTLAAWGTPAFAEAFKEEVRKNRAGLPLQKGLNSTSYALDERVEAMVIGTAEKGNFLIVKAGAFFQGLLIGCSCADDPTPVGEENEYCELFFRIDRKTGETLVFFPEDHE